MKKIVSLSFLALIVMSTLQAQSGVKTHIIKEGETLTLLAKKYGTTVGDIMRLNAMTTTSKLSVGEKVKIPSGHVPATAASEASVPDSHIVEKGETLYSLSRKYGISVTKLQDYNNIQDNTIKLGQTLFLKQPTDAQIASRDAAAKESAAVTTVATVTPAAPIQPATTTDVAAQNAADDAALKQNEVKAGTDTNAPIVSDQSKDTNATQGAEVVKNRSSSVFDPNTKSASSDANEGIFATAYKSQANGTELITKGKSGIFKSASGWKDKKYFILMNEAKPGSLVKVQAGGKTVYAKVLWNLGNIAENTGLSYRLSDAAVQALGISDQSFDLIVSYFK